MFVVRNRKIFLGLSAFFVVVAIVVTALFGLNFGIDFTGGSLLEVSYPDERPRLEELETRLGEGGFQDAQVQPAGERGYIVRFQGLAEGERALLLETLRFEGELPTQERFTTIGPTIGNELRSKAITALSIVLVAIILFVAFAFRKVSEPVSSWKYGVAAILALIHDIAIPVGAFVLLGRFLGVEIDLLFVAALLAILGYSVNDTIVVFDRVREGLLHNRGSDIEEPFEDTVGKSLEQTYARSINTSLTTLLVLTALVLLGGESTRYFSLALLIGVVAGTYSSIFLASPLLVTMSKNARSSQAAP